MNTSTICKALVTLMSCLLCVYTYAQDDPKYVPGQMLVKMKANKTVAQKSALKIQLRAIKHRTLKNDTEVWRIDETNGKVDIEQLTEQYRNHPDIEFVEPNYYYYLADRGNKTTYTESVQNLVPNDTHFGVQWGMTNINAPASWDIITGSPFIKVAVLDTGVDWAHEDLAENMWQNLCEDADGDGKVLEKVGQLWQFDPDDMDGIDNDGNGYADDFIGWDFVNNDEKPEDYDGHGTHIAGVLGAKGDDNNGVAGVAWNVQIMAIKVFDINDEAPVDSIISALNYAIEMGAKISNNSWGGGPRSTALEQAIQDAANAGHLFVTAAGNRGNDMDNETKFFPASYNSDNIISVAATNSGDSLAYFSNYGANTVDIAAPGDSIYSCLPTNKYGYMDGTSMAAPHVAGACALLWSLQHEKDYSEIKNAIMTSATKPTALNDKTISDGRLNLYNALTHYTPVPAPQTPPVDSCPSLCRMNDSLALVAIYNTNGGNLSWDLTQPIDNLSGVTLNEQGCVSELNINIDIIPPEIGNLSNLFTLDLEYNDITSIPPEIGNLANLKVLELEGNQITSLPPEIGNLSNLVTLDLDYNDVTTIPPEIGNLQNLTSLKLRNNEITNLPPEIGSLYNLKILNISFNQITSIPPEIENLNNLEELYANNNQITILSPEMCEPNNLKVLNLGYNQITSLPQQIRDLRKLEYLYLQVNQITHIRYEIGFLKNLRTLYAFKNQITNFPQEIGNLEKLEKLYLYNNQITGGIPKEIGDLVNLEKLWIHYNQMTGCYPLELINICNQLTSSHVQIQNGNTFDATWSDFCNTGAGGCGTPNCRQNDSLSLVALYNATNGVAWLNTWDISQPITTWYGVTTNVLGCVTALDLSNNDLIGTLPPEIGNLNLLNLDLSNNFLSGTIPTSLGNMSRLLTLNLSDNQLSGNIPPELGELNQLTTLNLFYNLLDGSIPPELNQLTRLTTLDLSDNLLTGTIPYELGTLPILTNLYLSDNQLSGNIPYAFEGLYYLDRMWLSGNQLSGCFSDYLSALCSRINPVFNKNTYITDGNNFDISWEDFCAGSSGSSCESVWPGDFNNDGIVTEEDALPWGLAYGFTGPKRDWLRQGTSTIVWTQGTPTTEWTAQPATEWAQSVDGVNSMWQDGDGDGIVDGDDLQVVSLNFGRIHNFNQPQSINSNIIYSLVRNGEDTDANPIYDLHVKDVMDNLISAHGLAFQIDFESLNIIEITMDVSASSLVPSDTFKSFNEAENKLYAALTRTDKTDQICDGAVASFIIITNNIPSGDPFEIRVRGGSKMESDGTREDILGTSLFDTYSNNPTDINPLIANVSVLHAQCTTYGMAWVTVSGGIGEYTYQWNTGEATDRITDLTPAIYEITVTDSVGRSETITATVEGQYLSEYDANGNLIDCIDSDCPTLLMPRDTVPPGTYQADRTVNSDGTLTGDTDYKAGETIIFGNGFEIPPNTNFSGTIEDCDDN